MNGSGGTVTIQVHAAIADIPAAAWDACAGDVNPTVSHAFLNAMEESGSTTTRTGWTPQHLSLAGPDGEIVGVVPTVPPVRTGGAVTTVPGVTGVATWPPPFGLVGGMKPMVTHQGGACEAQQHWHWHMIDLPKSDNCT